MFPPVPVVQSPSGIKRKQPVNPVKGRVMVVICTVPVMCVSCAIGAIVAADAMFPPFDVASTPATASEPVVLTVGAEPEAERPVSEKAVQVTPENPVEGEQESD